MNDKTYTMVDTDVFQDWNGNVFVLDKNTKTLTQVSIIRPNP